MLFFQAVVFATIYFSGYYWRWLIAAFWVVETTLAVLIISPIVMVQFGTLGWAFTLAGDRYRPPMPEWKARLSRPPWTPHSAGGKLGWLSALSIRNGKWRPCLGETSATFEAWCRAREQVLKALDEDIQSIPQNKRWTWTAWALRDVRGSCKSKRLEHATETGS